ncbi:MAG: TolC family protein [Elusimicrobiota bacterium]|jgi:adhesin transport system outer membrane protein|nr:TolC family protein [Elusimicrobiota bacterium]
MNKIIFVLIFTFLFPLPIAAKKINWNFAAATTLENNSDIKSARIELENARFSYYSALGNFAPSINLNAGLSKSDNDMPQIDGSRAFGHNLSTNYSYGVSGNFSIFAGFSDYFQARLALFDLETAKAAYERTVSDIMYKAYSEYVNLMWAYERVDLVKKIRNKRIENRDMINLKYKSGNVDLGSLRRTEADMETANLDLRKALRNIETVSSALYAAMGVDGDEILETDEQIPATQTPPAKPDFSSLIKEIPEYKIADYSLKTAEAQNKNAKSSFLPNISISASLNQNNPDKPQSQDAVNSWSANLTASYPLFNGMQDLMFAKISANKYEAAKSKLKQTLLSLKAQSIGEYNAVLDAFETINLRVLYLQAAQLQSEISDRKYINGLSSYQDWYMIDNDYIGAQNNLLEAKRAAALQMARWLNFIGEKDFSKGK